MAEGGMLGGILDGDDESPELEEASDSLIAANEFAAAITVLQSADDSSVANATKVFLEKQGHLLDVQVRHLEDEHPFRLSHLRHQSQEGKLRRTGQRFRIGLQAVTALLAILIGAGLLVMVHDAFHSESVVVESFDAPPDLANRGLTGKVVATDLLDALQRLQEATRSTSKALNVQSAWSTDVKIEVPETGLSVGDINRLLHERFGHDLHIEGDLVQIAEGGLALTVRGDGISSHTFTGTAGDLDKLTTQAAEYVYGRSQPYQFVHYLNGIGRSKDALEFLPGAFARATDNNQRAEFANEWGDAFANLNQPLPAMEKYRMAMALVPRFWKSWDNLVGILPGAEGEEAAWQEGRAMLQAVQNTPKADRPDVRLLYNPAQITWDLPLVLASIQAEAERNSGAGASTMIAGPGLADSYALMHDPAQAARYMAASDPGDASTKAEALLLQGYAALEHGNAAAAVSPLQAFWTAWQADSSLQFSYYDNPCLLGLAYGLVGRTSDAEAVFARMGSSRSRCWAYRGDALEHAGDLAGAERVWAEGLKVVPDLPWIYLRRGQSEENRGDLKAAETDLATASAKAPHWADPWKAWGDVLLREGRNADALAKYNEALKYAPAWEELHQVRDTVARRKS
jgi:tetratricopeptide (TPR) repeat protein